MTAISSGVLDSQKVWQPGDTGVGSGGRVLRGQRGWAVAWQPPVGTAVSAPVKVTQAWPCTPSTLIISQADMWSWPDFFFSPRYSLQEAKKLLPRRVGIHFSHGCPTEGRSKRVILSEFHPRRNKFAISQPRSDLLGRLVYGVSRPAAQSCYCKQISSSYLPSEPLPPFCSQHWCCCIDEMAKWYLTGIQSNINERPGGTMFKKSEFVLIVALTLLTHWRCSAGFGGGHWGGAGSQFVVKTNKLKTSSQLTVPDDVTLLLLKK